MFIREFLIKAKLHYKTREVYNKNGRKEETDNLILQSVSYYIMYDQCWIRKLEDNIYYLSNSYDNNEVEKIK